MSSADPVGGLPAETWLEKFLRFSVFAFASPTLESRFHQYSANSINLWTALFCIKVLVGWLLFVGRFFAFPAERAHLPPDWALALTQPLVSAAILGAMLLMPEFFRKHQRGIRALTICFIPLTSRQARAALLWMRSIESTSDAHTAMQMLRFFSVENVHLLAALDIVVAFPVGQIPDLLLTTLRVLVVMADNQYICGLPRLAENLVTMTPGLLSAKEAGSMVLRNIGVVSLGITPQTDKLSCPAAFGFFQLLGGVFACVLVFVADVLRRRAFLRTPETLAYLGPGYKAAALNWPFRSTYVLYKGILTGTVAVCLLTSLVWNNALYFLL
eukprot:jgi/Botrbrau1/5904/Bobra.0366s0082.1